MVQVAGCHSGRAPTEKRGHGKKGQIYFLRGKVQPASRNHSVAGRVTMPRMGGTVLPYYAHRIIQRGHNRQLVFAESRDFERYLQTLAEFEADPRK
jgi:hypothetical protein